MDKVTWVIIIGAMAFVVVVGGYFILKGVYQAPPPVEELTPTPKLVEPMPPAAKTAIAVEDQQVIEDAVKIQEVSFENPGYVVIHLSEDGKPGKVLGNSGLFKSGTYNEISVMVSNLQEGENKLFAMVHFDDGDSIYKFPGDDIPAKVDDKIVVKSLTVTKTTVVPQEEPITVQEPTPEPAPEPVVEPEPALPPEPIPEEEPTSTSEETAETIVSRTVEADDNGLYPATVTVPAGATVNLTFKVRLTNVYFGGLDFRSSKFSTGKVPPGGETTVTFTTTDSFQYSSYWPSSGTKKADGMITVSI